MGIIETIKRLGFFRGDRDSTSESAVSNNSIDVPSEYASTVAFNECFEALLEQDKFIARSDYEHLISQYESLSQF